MPLFSSRHFVSLPLANGLLADFSDDPHPTRVHGWRVPQGLLNLGADGTHFGFVLQGPTHLTFSSSNQSNTFKLSEGMYFSVPSAVQIEGGAGIVVSRLDFHGFFLVGGPIEQVGRLRYIDGCSDSLIISPIRKGDPCLNHLHFPQRISQTRHTHPSIRVGTVARGQGRCVVPAIDDESGPDVEIPLVPGEVFVIPTNGQHSFFTDEHTMDVIAYHPDSDTGPEDDDHPMINRTIVGGVPASQIESIKTRTQT